MNMSIDTMEYMCYMVKSSHWGIRGIAMVSDNVVTQFLNQVCKILSHFVYKFSVG